jgi:superfamily I DNA/RNA helicase
LQEECEGGTPASRIGFITMTKVAAREAKSRLVNVQGVKDKDIKWIRTSHSAACGLMTIRLSEIWGSQSDWDALQDKGYPCERAGKTEINPYDSADKTGWDVCHFVYSVIRSRMQSLDDGLAHYNSSNENLYPEVFKQFVDAYEQCKREQGKVDFSDMLSLYLNAPDFPTPFDVLFLDEAQDFSRLQWQVINKLCRNGVERLYVAGDDDQAIYGFTGADELGFLNMQADEEEVLKTSWRCPPHVGKTAMAVSAQLSQRKDKDIQWREDRDGAVKWSGLALEELPFKDWAQGDQQVMILHRHRMPLYGIQRMLRDQGIMTTMDGLVSKSRAVEMAVVYHDLKSDRKVESSDASRLLTWKGFRSASDKMRKRKGLVTRADLPDIDFDADWISYLARGKPKDIRQQTRELQEARGVFQKFGLEPLKKPTRIDLSTYHSAKGREADLVVCVPDCNGVVFGAQAKEPDTELRVAYVGLTRTKGDCIILCPSGQKSMIGLKPTLIQGVIS